MQSHTDCDYPHDHTRFLLHGRLQEPKSAGHNPKIVLDDPSPVAQLVIEYTVIDVNASVEERFHQPGLEGEGVVTDEDVLILGPMVHK